MSNNNAICHHCHGHFKADPELYDQPCQLGHNNIVSRALGRYVQKFGPNSAPPPPPTPVGPPPMCPVGVQNDLTPGGRKAGKVRADLVIAGFPNALMALAKVMGWAIEGKGYDEGDWANVPDAAKKYRAGMYRHDLKESIGPVEDDESGLHHAIHTAWNSIARLEMLVRTGVIKL